MPKAILLVFSVLLMIQIRMKLLPKRVFLMLPKRVHVMSKILIVIISLSSVMESLPLNSESIITLPFSIFLILSNI